MDAYNPSDFSKDDWELLKTIVHDCVLWYDSVPAHVHGLAARLKGGDVHVVSSGLVFGVYESREEAQQAASRASKRFLGNFEASSHGLGASRS